jgi:hypothetical protein
MTIQRPIRLPEAGAARRGVILLACLLGLTPAFVGTPTDAAASHSTQVSISASTTGSSGSITAVRDGWGATIRLAVRDTKADGDCAFATVSLDVATGPDPSRRTNNCSGAGSVRLASFRLSANVGTSIRAVKLKVCRDRSWWPDNCSTRSVTLPQMHAHATAARIAATETIMRLSLTQFLVLKSQAPAPYDWADDGCSVPGWLPYTSAFNPACERHDFGYRNFGGDQAYNPSDSRRSFVDSRFLADMDSICVDRYPVWARPPCYASASAGYSIVRTLGGRAFFGED